MKTTSRELLDLAFSLLEQLAMANPLAAGRGATTQIACLKTTCLELKAMA